MRLCIVCVFLLALSGETWAQLTCTYCEYSVTGWTGKSSSTQSSPHTLLRAAGTFNDLRGGVGVSAIAKDLSVFAINGTGYYTINTNIGVNLVDWKRYGFTLSAPSAGGWGGQNAGLILTGRDDQRTYPNFYTGETVINGGFIACKKPRENLGSWNLSRMKAILGDIKLKTTTPGLESGLWFGADEQLGGDGVWVRSDGVLRFETANANAIVSLNGTTQRLRGIEATNANAILENIEPSPVNIPNIGRNLNKAVLILTGTSGRYVMSGALLRAGGGAGYNGGLEVRVEGNSQVIKDPGSNLENVTFTTTTGGSRLELNTSSQQVFTIGGSVVFTGETGTYLKTGPGEIRPDNFIPNAANIQVDGGTFTLVGNSKLGGDSYSGSVSIAAGAVLELNNSVRINFRGPITGAGTLRRTGEGVTLISGGRKDFTGEVRMSGNGCFFGGYCDISDAAVYVSSNAKIGGGEGQDDVGGTLTVGDLTFESRASKLVVTSMSGIDGTPSLVVVESRGRNNAGNITLREGNFTVDLVGGNNLSSGYVLKCANGVSGNFPLPTTGINNTGKVPFFRWDNMGLYLSIGEGLSCDNCTFGGTTGTPANPAVILGSPGTFAGNITLNGSCNFSITGTGNYTLSGIISGSGPLTYNASNAGQQGLGAGITLQGGNANTYSGLTTIKSGYIICNKTDGKASVPGDSKVSASSGAVWAHLWCRTNNQLGSGGVLDFRDARSYSYIHLNGTTQTVAGLQANNDKAVVENNWDDGFLPAGMTAAQRSTQAAILNIAAGSTTYTFAGGGFIRKGTDVSPALTVNVTGGTQIIQDPDDDIRNVTLASQGTAMLELKNSDGNFHVFGTGVTFAGTGILKKTGARPIATNNSTLLRSGLIWVYDGAFRNDQLSNVYTGNTATLQVDAPNGNWDNHSPTFDIWGNNSIFGGLTGGGWVQNNFGAPGRDGYNDFTVGQNNNYAVFEGVIRDNSANGPVSGGGLEKGGVALRKTGTGVQVLKGDNRYTGSTTVSSGTLQLQGNGQLGNAATAGTYNGTLEISNVSGGQAIFEHNGDKIQVFTGNITNTGPGSPGLFIQSGTGKTIINGDAAKDFTGDINITAGFLGGSGNLSKAGSLYVGASGSIGGGDGVDDKGATLTIAGLNFLAAASKLIVTSASATDATPSLLDVRNGNGQATISAAFRFTVDLVSDNLKSGYLIKCTNGVTGGFSLPALGINNTGKTPLFKWDAQGLYMGLGEGLTCDNCTFNGITGTIASPAVILASPGIFTGNITLNGACNFRIAGTGDYHLSGIISGSGPLTYNAPNAGQQGHDAGITLEGDNANTYSGLTTIKSGYIICNKTDGKVSVPGDIKLSAPPSANVQLWCRTNNQLGNGGVLDFRDAQNYSFINLNGTTQTVAGLQANNGNGVVENNWDDGFLPAGMTPAQRSTQAATLNIAAGATTYTFAGGGFIRKGTDVSPALTVNVTSGRQVIENPGFNITNVTLASSQGATLEFSTSDNNSYSLGGGVTFRGEGTLKKTGAGVVMTHNSTILKSGLSLIVVSEGLLRNDYDNNVYSNGSGTNTATLQIEAPSVANNNPTFDLWGNVSIFDGLTGGGIVQNGWGSTQGSPPGGGYSWLTLGQNNSQGNPVFDGVIKDNQGNGPVSASGFGAGGIALGKVGSGLQVLRGENIYTGRTSVSSGTLRMEGDGVLGATGMGGGSYGGVLEIANVPSGTAAVFEHKGDKKQVITGNISTAGTGTILGTYLQSGAGKTIIEGVKTFSGNVSVSAGLLGGSGDLSQVNRVTVEEGGNIGGGNGGRDGGAVLTVSNLTFAAVASKLRVTSRGDNTPSLVDVRSMGSSITGSGSITAGNGFTVDVSGGTNLVSGYIINCTNGVGLPLPTLGENNTQKPVCFKWDAAGLYMTLGSAVVFNQPANLTANSGQAQEAIAFTTTGTGTAPTGYQWKGSGDVVGLTDYTADWTQMAIPAFTVVTTSSTLSRTIEVTAINSTTGCTAVKTFTYTVSPAGLTCDNCTFNGITGTIASPAVILASPGTFTGNITLNGACNFSITGPGNYILSGIISGTGPLTYNAPDAGQQGHGAGITLEGDNANTYSGLTTIKSGYIICNKTDGKVSIPGDSKVSATSSAVYAQLWCRTNNQLGNGGVLDFRDAQSYSYIHLNGTTQTVAGLQANNDKAVVENNWDNTSLPSGMTPAQRSTQAATLNIAAGSTTYTFGGGGSIRKGTDVSPALTVNVTSGSQIIQDPDAHINNVTFLSSVNAQGEEATLEFKSGDGNAHTIGSNVTFGGAGILKKTGTALITTNTSTILKTGGKIWVTEGVFRNEHYSNRYANADSTQINKAALQVDANASFDMWANVSIFDGLTGGGTVQNYWGPPTDVNVLPGGGYCWLTLGQNDSQGNPVFDGVIKDNPGNGPVSANGPGVGGIALKKVGSGLQVLRGGNIYTGRTRVSSGTLRLEGNGVLGATGTGGSYGGILEIANVPAGTAAVFEHKGDKTQVITGNISTTGTGTLLGTYLQSGAGKTIINGVKSFTGNVSVTAGFLGGSGDLSQVNRVTVEEGGSIGGGNGETAGGAALTVSNLTFATVASKLRVTSRGDNTPSLVDVRSMGSSTTGSGSITAANGFTVEVNGAAIVSGYVLKCSNGLTGNLPLPTVVNNTGRTVCFRWDGTGLWMQIGFGNITLTSTSLCLAINPVNLVVTVTAAYSDPRDYPPLGAAIDFSLSDPSVKSGEMTVTRVQGSTVIATFNGKNQTTSDKSYTVTYDDTKNCAVKLDAAIEPQPVLRVSSGNNPTCKGTPVELQATGRGLLTISSATINTTVVSITSSVGLDRAGSTPLGNAVFFATDANGCRSENLSVLVKELPVLDAIPNQSVCSGASVDPYIPPSSGVGESKPTSYQWEMKANALNRDNVGLSNHTADWTKPAISHFIAENTTDGVLKRDVTVSAYNSATGCTSASRVYTITVNPNPVISLDNPLVSKFCSGSIVDNLITQTPLLTGTWSITDVGATGNSNNSIGSSITTNTEGKGALTAGTVDSDNAVEQDIRYQLGSCVSNALRVTINPKPTVTLSDVTLCGNTQQNPITPGTGSGLRAADGYKWQQSGDDRADVGLPDSSTPEWSAVIPSFSPPATGDVLTRSMSITPYNSATRCIGDAYTWKITISPNPLISFDNALSSLCSGSVNKMISKTPSTGTGTWSITDVGATGNSNNSIGSSVTTNTEGKGALTAGTVDSDNAVEQDIRYQLGSCVSNTLRVTINPKPTVTLSDVTLCGNTQQNPITPVTGSGLRAADGYKWQQSGDDRADVGLPDSSTPEWSAVIPSFTPPGGVGLVRSMSITPYNSTTRCIGDSRTWKIIINPNPVISFDNALSSLCSGSGNKMISKTPSTGTGTWSITDVGATGNSNNSIGTIITTNTDGKGALTAGTVDSDNAVEQDIRYQLGSCVSNALRVTINPKPTVTLSDVTLCGNTQQDRITPGTGSGLRAADGYKWQQSGDDRADVGLPDSSTPEWSAVLPSFTPPGGVGLVRSMSITPRNSRTTCIGDSRTWKIIINPNPVISFNDALSSLCSGSGNKMISKTPSTGTGTWSITDVGATGNSNNSIGSIITTNTEGKGALTAGTVDSDNAVEQDIRYQLGSCVSNALRVTINPKPTVTLSDVTLCGNTQQDRITPGTGSGLRAADGYKWQQSGDDRADVGLPDSSTPEWSAAIPSFTPPGGVGLVRSMSITPRNSRTTCIGDAYTWKIIINPNPLISFDNALSSLCSGSGNKMISKTPSTGTGTWSITDVGATGNSNNGIGTIITTNTDGKGALTAGTVDSDNAVEQDIRYQSGSCVSNILRVTINPKPTVTLSDVTLCGNTQQDRITPVTGSGLRAADGYKWQQSGADRAEVGLPDSSTPEWSAAIPSFTPPGGVGLVRSMSITPRNSRTTCIGDAYTWKIIINPNPLISFDNALSSLCSGSGNKMISKTPSTGTGTWSITDVGATGNSNNSIGSSITTNTEGKGALTAGTVDSDNAVEQDIRYQLGSCVSNALRVTINPKPTVTLSDVTLCGNTQQNPITPGTGRGLRAADGYKWQQSGADRADVGLPDSSTPEWSAVIPSFTPPGTGVGLVRSMSITPRNSRTTCIGDSRIWKIIVNPNPVISANTIDVSKLCSGLSYTNALVCGEGTRAVYKTGTEEAGRSTVANSTSGYADLQAATVTVKTVEDIVLTFPATSCKNKLTITIYPKPVMNEIPDLVTCGKALVAAYIPPSSGEREARPTHYKWKVAANAVNSAAVGLADTDNWTEVISQFTATNPVNTIALKRDVTVSAYNSTSGCQAESQVYTITVNPSPAVSYTATSPICNGIETDIVLRSTLSPTTYTWTVNNNNAGARSQTTSSNTSFIRQILTNSGSSPETVTYKVTGTSGQCSSTVSIPIEVSNTDPAIPTVTGGGHYCANIENGSWQTDLKPSVQGKNVEWTYTTYYGNNQAEGSLTGNTQKTERGTLTSVKDNLVLSNTPSASVYYVFRPFSGCFGTPSAPIGVRLYAAPVIAAIPLQEICSSSEAYPTTANIALSTSTPDVVYTWTVDRTNGRDITGYSEPSREGARVPTQNPSQARTGPIADALSLPANAAAQTLDYSITPWHLGCPGKAVSGRVKVNPLPTVIAPADREHCLGNADLRVAAEPLKGTASAFTWTGGAKAGLADQTIYGSGLPAYKVAATTAPAALKVKISGKNDKGCKASTTFNIRVNPKPSITLGNSQILCTGPTIETAAQTNIEVSSPVAGTKYKWTATFVDFRPDGKSVVKIVNGNNELLSLPVRESPGEEGNFIKKITAATGSYAQITLRLTPVLGGCTGEGKDTDIVVKGLSLLPDVVNNSPSICNGAATDIKIGKEGDTNTYSWERINNSNNILTPASPTSSRVYTTISDVLTLSSDKRDSIIYRIIPSRRFTAADGSEYQCNGKSVFLTVFVNPIPVLSISPATASICSGEKTAITPSLNLVPPESNNVYYSWEVTPNTLGARSSSGFQATIPKQVLTADNASESSVTYTITPQYQHGTGGGCKGLPATSTYQVSANVKVNISSVPEAVCLGDKVILKTDTKGGDFQWLKDGEVIPEATGDFYVVPTDELSVSSYTVRAKAAGCGDATSEARVVKVSADAYFTGGSAAMDKAAAAIGEVVKFSYTGPIADYLWDFNDNTPTLNTESATHSYAKLGTYYPTLKATKKGQAACTKTFSLSFLEIRDGNSRSLTGYGVFPIPARDRITITNEDDLQNITLSDMTGKMILNEAVKGRNITLSVAHIAPGIYLLTITDSKGGVKRLEVSKE